VRDKNQFDAMLNSYNIFSMINSPIRIQNGSRMATDNIFLLMQLDLTMQFLWQLMD